MRDAGRRDEHRACIHLDLAILELTEAQQRELAPDERGSRADVARLGLRGEPPSSVSC